MSSLSTLKKTYRNLLRKSLNSKNRHGLAPDLGTVSIISSNCIGGVILHELGLQFATPTINLYMEPKSYLTFVSNLDLYLTLELEEVADTGKTYPIGCLGPDVTIHFLHYDNFAQAKEKWETRAKRVNRNRLYFILADRDGLTREDAERFEALVFPNKVLLTYKDYPGLSSVVNLGSAYQDGNNLIDLCQYKGKLTGKRYIDDFDYVAFLNEAVKKD